MNVYILQDNEYHYCYGVIVSEKTTVAEVADIIEEEKYRHPGEWDVPGIIKHLPEDCSYYNVYDTNNVILI